jgi:hypothetical protein
LIFNPEKDPDKCSRTRLSNHCSTQCNVLQAVQNGGASGGAR